MVEEGGKLLLLSPYGRAQTRMLDEVPAVVISLDTAAARLLAPDATKAAEAQVLAAAEEAAKRAGEAANAAAQATDAAGRAAAALLAEEKAREARETAAKPPPVFDGYEQTVLVIYKNGQAESIRWYNGGESSFAAGFPSLGAVPLAAHNRRDTIGAVMTNGKVLLFSLGENKIIWSADSHITAGLTAPEITFVYDERGLYALTKGGATAYTGDGKQRWTIRLPGSASPPAFDDEGILYAGGSDWVLNAYHMEDIIKGRKQSLYGLAAPGSYTNGDPRPSPWAKNPNLYDPGEMNARLGRIANAIRKGQVGENERSYAAYLMEIAGSMEAAPQTEESLNHPPVQVTYRAEAARLLAYIGSRETIPFLANLCRSDPDNVVKAAAAEAIGVIGVDPDGIALAAFTALVFPQIPGRDERVMASIAAATGALCRFSGPPLSREGTRVLTAIASLGPGFAQGVAQRELQTLVW
jgi:outer membrane protein assembly factor BamB